VGPLGFAERNLTNIDTRTWNASASARWPRTRPGIEGLPDQQSRLNEGWYYFFYASQPARKDEQGAGHHRATDCGPLGRDAGLGAGHRRHHQPRLRSQGRRANPRPAIVGSLIRRRGPMAMPWQEP
jgi:hypothetical protein